MKSLLELKNKIMAPVEKELMKDVVMPKIETKNTIKKEDFEGLNKEQVKILLEYQKWWILGLESNAKRINMSKSNLHYHLKLLMRNE